MAARLPDRAWINFDEYSHISWKAERKRIDNFIIQLKNTNNPHAYLVVYGGRRSCRGEARLRGERVKNYIIRSGGFSSAPITIIDAGYLDQWKIELWIGIVGGPPLTKEIVQPLPGIIPDEEVKIFERCESSLYDRR